MTSMRRDVPMIRWPFRPVVVNCVVCVLAPAAGTLAALGRYDALVLLAGVTTVAGAVLYAIWQVRPDVRLPRPRELRACSTPTLCRAWRTSAALVRSVRGSSPRKLAKWVALRQAYLDELERRDRDGFARWLAEEPERTAPEAYIGGEPRR